MTMTETRVFVPNAVFIPASAVWKDRRGEHADPEDCTPLYIEGDRNYGEVYTREAWEQGGKPSYVLRDDTYFMLCDDGKEEFLCRAGLGISDQEPVEGDRIQLLPEMWCVKEDETEYWDEQFRKRHKIKRILGVYLFNRRKAAYLCEMTPSYERRFFGSQWEPYHSFEDDDYSSKAEEIEDALRDGDRGTEEWSYMHCSDVDRLLKTEIKEHGGWFPPDGRGGGGYKVTGLVSVTEEDAIEEIREGMCNGDL
jgi:hypothetical protein